MPPLPESSTGGTPASIGPAPVPTSSATPGPSSPPEAGGAASIGALASSGRGGWDAGASGLPADASGTGWSTPPPFDGEAVLLEHPRNRARTRSSGDALRDMVGLCVATDRQAGATFVVIVD